MLQKTNDPQGAVSVTRDDLIRIGRALRLVEKLSREILNHTPVTAEGVPPPRTVEMTHGGLPQSEEASSWPVEVTGSPEVSLSHPELADLKIGTLYIPAPESDPPWQEEQCWVISIPGVTLNVGDVGIGRLVGWRDADGDTAYDGMPIYSIVPGASSPTSSVGDVIGPDHAFTGAVTIFSDPSGRFIDTAKSVEFTTSHIGGFRLTTMAWTVPGDFLSRGNPGVEILTVGGTQNRTSNEGPSTSCNKVFVYGVGTNTGLDAHTFTEYFSGSSYEGTFEAYRFEGNTANGFIYTELVTVGGTPTVVRSHSSTQVTGMQYWMRHYAHLGEAGISTACTVKVGGMDKTMTIIDGIVTDIS